MKFKPTTEMVRRAGLIEWLSHYGISTADVDQMITDGTLTRVKLRPNARGYYRVEEVVSKVLKKLEVV